MYGAGGFHWRRDSRTLARKGPTVKAQLKNAAITTAIVLATIYVLRQVAVTRQVVDKALLG